MREKLMSVLRGMAPGVAWNQQEFNEKLAAGKRRAWTQRIAAGSASRCPRCGRRQDECGRAQVR